MNIDETRWHMSHFDDDDPIEKESIRLTVEILKTVATVVFGLFVVVLVL